MATPAWLDDADTDSPLRSPQREREHSSSARDLSSTMLPIDGEDAPPSSKPTSSPPSKRNSSTRVPSPPPEGPNTARAPARRPFGDGNSGEDASGSSPGKAKSKDDTALLTGRPISSQVGSVIGSLSPMRGDGGESATMEYQLSALKHRRKTRENSGSEPGTPTSATAQNGDGGALTADAPPKSGRRSVGGAGPSESSSVSTSSAPPPRPGRRSTASLTTAITNIQEGKPWDKQSEALQEIREQLLLLGGPNDSGDQPETHAPTLGFIEALRHGSGTGKANSNLLSEMVNGMLLMCDNGRSSVAKTAIDTVGLLCTKLGSKRVIQQLRIAQALCMDPHCDAIAAKLIGKAGGGGSKFLNDSCMFSLREMVNHAAPQRTVNALLAVATPLENLPKTERSKSLLGESLAHAFEIATPAAFVIGKGPTPQSSPSRGGAGGGTGTGAPLNLPSVVSRTVVIVEVLVHDAWPDVRDAGRRVGQTCAELCGLCAAEGMPIGGQMGLNGFIRSHIANPGNMGKVMKAFGEPMDPRGGADGAKKASSPSHATEKPPGPAKSPRSRSVSPSTPEPAKPATKKQAPPANGKTPKRTEETKQEDQKKPARSKRNSSSVGKPAEEEVVTPAKKTTRSREASGSGDASLSSPGLPSPKQGLLNTAKPIAGRRSSNNSNSSAGGPTESSSRRSSDASAKPKVRRRSSIEKESSTGASPGTGRRRSSIGKEASPYSDKKDKSSRRSSTKERRESTKAPPTPPTPPPEAEPTGNPRASAFSKDTQDGAKPVPKAGRRAGRGSTQQEPTASAGSGQSATKGTTGKPPLPKHGRRSPQPSPPPGPRPGSNTSDTAAANPRGNTPSSDGIPEVRSSSMNSSNFASPITPRKQVIPSPPNAANVKPNGGPGNDIVGISKTSPSTGEKTAERSGSNGGNNPGPMTPITEASGPLSRSQSAFATNNDDPFNNTGTSVASFGGSFRQLSNASFGAKPGTPQAVPLVSPRAAIPAKTEFGATLSKEMHQHGKFSQAIFASQEGNFEERFEALSKINKLCEDKLLQRQRFSEGEDLNGTLLEKTSRDDAIEEKTGAALCEVVALRCADTNSHVQQAALQTVPTLLKVVSRTNVDAAAPKFVSCITSSLGSSYREVAEYSKLAIRAVVRNCSLSEANSLMCTIAMTATTVRNAGAKCVLVDLMRDLVNRQSDLITSGDLERRNVRKLDARFVVDMTLKLLDDARPEVVESAGDLVTAIRGCLMGDEELLALTSGTDAQRAALKNHLNSQPLPVSLRTSSFSSVK